MEEEWIEGWEQKDSWGRDWKERKRRKETVAGCKINKFIYFKKRKSKRKKDFSLINKLSGPSQCGWVPSQRVFRVAQT